MCTLLVAWRLFPEAPICVAANRDELFDRPASKPTVWDREPAVVSPRDEQAGGTWIGYNEDGVVVAVTNRWVEGEGERSRGLLVTDALAEPTAAAAVERVRTELAVRQYAPFHLLVADADSCTLIEHDDERDRVRELSPGVHIVVNVGADGEWFVPSARPNGGRRQAENAERVLEAAQPIDGETAAAWTERVGRILGDHDYGVCLHGDRFGTRSSSTIRLGDERVFAFADGPPCVTPHRRIEESL